MGQREAKGLERVLAGNLAASSMPINALGLLAFNHHLWGLFIIEQGHQNQEGRMASSRVPGRGEDVEGPGESHGEAARN